MEKTSTYIHNWVANVIEFSVRFFFKMSSQGRETKLKFTKFNFNFEATFVLFQKFFK